MKWVIVFVHMLGNPSYTTSYQFNDRAVCEAHAKRLDKGHADQWYHACVRM